jgi:outer membrane protein
LQRSYTDDLSATVDEKEQDILKATINWPFYSGGKKRSTINKNSNLTYTKKITIR